MGDLHHLDLNALGNGMDVPVDDMININPIQILCGAIKQRGDPDRSDLYTPGFVCHTANF